MKKNKRHKKIISAIHLMAIYLFPLYLFATVLKFIDKYKHVKKTEKESEDFFGY